MPLNLPRPFTDNQAVETQSSPSTSTPLPVSVSDRRRHLWIAVAVALVVAVVYVMTMCRTIYTGDEGDFLTAMATLGIPHPTGYPLFCLVGHAWLALFPVGSPAFKINLLTALCGAASVGFFCRFLLQIVPARRWYAAPVGALALGFAPTLWQQSLSCEVYALTCVFLAAILYLAVGFQVNPTDTTRLRWMAALYGLALTNHMTMALFLPGFLAFVIAQRPTLLRSEFKVLLSLVVCFALPLSLYLYLPWVALHGTAPIPWGDPRNWANFKAQVTGEMFGERMFSGWAVTAHQTHLYGTQVWAEFGGPILLLLSAFGATALWRRGRDGRALTLLLGWVLVADLTFALNYDVFDVYVYFIPSYLVLATLFTVGAATLLDVFEKRVGSERLTHSAAWRAVPLMALLLTLMPLSHNWTASDESGNYLEDDLSANILRSAPQHALVIASSNATFSLWYRRFVLNERPDVVPIYAGMARGMDRYGAWYHRHIARMYPEIDRTDAPGDPATPGRIARGEFLADTMQKAVERGVPVLVLPDARYNKNKIAGHSFDELIAARFDRVPWGVCDRLFLKGSAPDARAITAANVQMWSTFQTRGLYTHWATDDPMQEHIGRRYTEASLALGEIAERAGQREVAQAYYQRVLQLYDVPAARAGLARCTPTAVAAR